MPSVFELNQFFNSTRFAVDNVEPSPFQPRLVPTGVDWLDTFLEGGLAENRVNLLDWAEGTEALQKVVLDSLFSHGFLGVSGEESVRDLFAESKKYPLVIHPFKMNGSEAASFFQARGRGAPTLVLSCLTTPTSVAIKFASTRRLRFTETQVRVLKDTESTLQGRISPIPSREKKPPVRTRFNRRSVV